jgi:hypothetical protein
MRKYAYLWKNLLALGLALLFVIPASLDFLAMRRDEPIVRTDALSQVRQLSDYAPGLTGTALDTEIYFFDSGRPGGAFLVLGGTHPNESAASLAAIAFIENIRVQTGKVLVIPRTNRSAFSHTSPLDGMQDFFAITLDDGSQRVFRVGNRLTNPLDQWPDLPYYRGASGRELRTTESVEMRNVDRLYPGSLQGTLTDQVCAGIKNLIDQEQVNLVMDMHEGSPEFRYLNYTMYHERAKNVAADMAFEMQLAGLEMNIELSGPASLGLSHRSLGDNTNALVTLMETYNPSMGPLHGKMDDELVIDGKEPLYRQAHLDGHIPFKIPEEGIPLDVRVARHLFCLDSLKTAYNYSFPENPIEFTGFSDYEALAQAGLGALLQPVANTP